MALQDALEKRLLLGGFWQNLLAGIPARRVLSLSVHSAFEGLGACRLRTPLLTKLVRTVAEHDALIVSNASLGHRVSKGANGGGGD